MSKKVSGSLGSLKPDCVGVTTSGRRCKNDAAPHSDVCKIHSEQTATEIALRIADRATNRRHAESWVADPRFQNVAGRFETLTTAVRAVGTKAQYRYWQNRFAVVVSPLLGCTPCEVFDHLESMNESEAMGCFMTFWVSLFEFAEDGLGSADDRRKLARSTMTVVYNAINDLYRSAGLVSPAEDPEIREALLGGRRLGQVKSPGKGEREGTPLLLELFSAAVLCLRQPDPDVAMRQAMVALRLSDQLQATSIVRLHWSDVTVRDGECTIVHEDRRRGLATESHFSSDSAVAHFLCRWRDMSTDAQIPGALVFSHDRRPYGSNARTGNARAKTPKITVAFTSEALASMTRSATKAFARQVRGNAPYKSDQALLIKLVDAMDTGAALRLRDATILSAGLYLALRRSNLHSLRRGDMKFLPPLPGQQESRIRLSIQWSKTNQAGDRPQHLFILAKPGKHYCPIALLEEWLSTLESTYGRPLQADDWIFPAFNADGSVSHRPLTEGSITDVLRRALRRTGLPEAEVRRYSSHSLRYGFATIAFNAGASPKEVQEHLGHANLTTTLNHYWRPTQGGNATSYVG